MAKFLRLANKGQSQVNVRLSSLMSEGAPFPCVDDDDDGHTPDKLRHEMVLVISSSPQETLLGERTNGVGFLKIYNTP